MSDELGTVASLVWIFVAQEILEYIVEIQIYAIPELRLPMVQVVNRVEVKVFFVPAKHCFPRPTVNVRGVDSWDLQIGEALPKK
jgi:hypothetical protein